MDPKTSRAPWADYKPSQKDNYGRTITTIYNLTEHSVVYLAEGDEISWDFNPRKCPNADRAVGIAQALVTRINSQLPKKKRYAGNALTYGALGLAMDSIKGADIRSFFEEAEQYIEAILNESLHLRFVGAAIIFSLFSAFPAVFYSLLIGKDNTQQILIAMALGACGALVSVLQRFSAIPIPRYSSWRFIVVRSFSRIMLGSIFAALFILFHRAGLILNLVSGNSSLLFSFAFISGLSERFIPELINQLEGKIQINVDKND